MAPSRKFYGNLSKRQKRRRHFEFSDINSHNENTSNYSNMSSIPAVLELTHSNSIEERRVEPDMVYSNDELQRRSNASTINTDETDHGGTDFSNSTSSDEDFALMPTYHDSVHTESDGNIVGKTNHDADDSQTCSSNCSEKLRDILGEWLAEEKNVPHMSVDRLLNKINSEFTVPKCSKTLLSDHNDRKIFEEMDSGDYVHFPQWIMDITKFIELNPEMVCTNTVNLIVNIDLSSTLTESHFTILLPTTSILLIPFW